MENYHIGIIGNRESWASQQLQHAFCVHGIEPEFGDASLFKAKIGEKCDISCSGISFSDMDLVLVRTIPSGSLEQIECRVDHLYHLEGNGVCLINAPDAVKKMVDKYRTSFLLTESGLRVPETVVVETPKDAIEAFNWLGGDVVLKPVFGSRGAGIVRLTDSEVALRTFDALTLGGYVYYLQRFIPHGNRDFRIMIVGDKMVASMQRCSDTWKTNLSKGGKPQGYQPSSEISALAQKAARIVDADYCGVDVMAGEDGLLYILEVNGADSGETIH